MQNFNHKNESKKNQEPIQPSQKAPQNNGNLWDKVVNWGVMLATKYGKTFEIIIWALMVIGIILLPILCKPFSSLHLKKNALSSF